MGMFEMIAAALTADEEFAAAIEQVEKDAAQAKQSLSALITDKDLAPITKNGLNYRGDTLLEGDTISVYTVANKGVALFHVFVNNSVAVDPTTAPAAMIGREGFIGVHPVRIVTVAGNVLDTPILAMRRRFNSGAEHIDSCELHTYICRNLTTIIAKIQGHGDSVPGC